MKKIGFVHIPKTAGGSIHHWFGVNNPDVIFCTSVHTFLEDIEKEHGKVDFSFTCVRNIYDKMISFYNWQGPKHTKKHQKSLKKYGTSIYTDEIAAYEKGIVEYIRYAKSTNNIMTISQLDYIHKVDFVMQMKDLENDFKIIQEYTNCYAPLEKTKHVLNYNAQDFFTKDFKIAVKEIFADEIEYFNWKPRF